MRDNRRATRCDPSGIGPSGVGAEASALRSDASLMAGTRKGSKVHHGWLKTENCQLKTPLPSLRQPLLGLAQDLQNGGALPGGQVFVAFHGRG